MGPHSRFARLECADHSTKDIKQFNLLFKPPPEIVLNSGEAQLFAYVFDTQLEFSLPPEFSEDVMKDKTLEEMESRCISIWMKLSEFLKYIYIPIEVSGHWFLMVVSLVHRCVFHLDTFVPVDEAVERRQLIIKVLNMLSQIMNSKMFGDDAVHTPPDLAAWSVVVAQGIPNMGNSYNSSAWVLDWVQMEDGCVPNPLGVLNDMQVRVKTALGIISSSHGCQIREST
ncbi:hypothetical protein RIF29_09776 [Crotalaria pallida]|uniref:Ubiquitin-like protease family profile domain-containing protein n=1 Tax=Crotalaria pallida TaxID=3830 RepID=A0AAN9FS74_CROPI